MFYKKNGIIYSLLVAGMAYLPSSVVCAQEALPLFDEPPTIEDAANKDADDNFKVSLEDELAPADNNKPAEEALTDSENSENTDNEEAPLNLVPINGVPEDAKVAEPSAQEEQPKEENNVLKAYNNFMETAEQQTENAETLPVPSNDGNSETLGEKIMSQVKEDLFSQMADIEKQTGLLTLELKREKIKNEIAAMRAQRQKAIDEEKEKQLERERKQKEWQKEQERKLVEEQQKLKELDIKYEKLRQERVLKSYKESMLKTNQEWIEYNARLYNQLVEEEKAQDEILDQEKKYFDEISASLNLVTNAAIAAKEKYNKEVANLQTQVAILKSKLEAEKTAFEESKKSGPNPFALAEEDDTPKVKVADEYAIMEISGKGEALVAKLINKNGATFMVKPGTVLNTGHVIEEITQTYIMTDKSGLKDYLYFSAGGILDKEPTKPISNTSMPTVAPVIESETPSIKLPSLREGMFVE